MENFNWYNPTRIIFGRGCHREAGIWTAKYSRKVLLVYGGKSLKATGTYDAVTKSLKDAGVAYTELSGIRPNPRLNPVYEGIEICKREAIDFVLAVGGGSVIDTGKAIALGVCYNGDVWDLYGKGVKPEKKLHMGVVLTIPAAGSESSDGSVITREEGLLKRSCCSDLLFPDFAILNPELCYTLPKEQIRAGGADILAHVMERYFAPNSNNDLTDRLCEGAMKTLMKNLPVVLEDVTNYDAWAEVMWTGNVAHSGLLGKGRMDDWASHNIEHELSALYDIPHGTGLAVIFPAWMKYVYREHSWRFVQFGQRVFGIKTEGKTTDEICWEAIEDLEDFYHRIGLPASLRELGIDESNFDRMAAKATGNDGYTLGSFKKLTKNDVKEIYGLAL